MNNSKNIIGKRIDLIFENFTPAIPEKKFVPSVSYNIALHNSSTIIGHCCARLGTNNVIFYVGHIGYAINEEYRGNGYAGEAVRLLLPIYKQTDIDKVYITNAPENSASFRVCEKLGAEFLGTYEIPQDNPMRAEQNKKYINVFELNIK